MQKTTGKKTNARRFIEAYNQIDYALRVQHNFKRSMGYSDMIRKAVVVNYIVRKYEDDLIDFGRLRNAIIHRSNDEYVIAEPHDEVVEEMEKIAKLITTPPKVLDSLVDRDVLSVQYDVSIKEVVELISTSSFSNIPVYKDGTLIGVANGQKILNQIGQHLAKGEDATKYLTQNSIESIVVTPSPVKYYDVAPATITIEEALNMFYLNRKLLVVLITKTGSMQEPPLGIITTTDIMDMNNILDNYD